MPKDRRYNERRNRTVDHPGEERRLSVTAFGSSGSYMGRRKTDISPSPQQLNNLFNAPVRPHPRVERNNEARALLQQHEERINA